MLTETYLTNSRDHCGLGFQFRRDYNAQMDLKSYLGEQLVFGISGSRITSETLGIFRETGAGGLILFRRNFESPRQLRELISGLEAKLERRLLVMIDHEGGRVIHLPSGVTFFPDSLVFGNAEDPELTRKQGEIEARELLRFGINLNLAPCVDVLGENFSPNIGIRSYGKNAEEVSRLALARIQGMRSAGLAACVKHFPGQGVSLKDAHMDLPVLDVSAEELESVHLKPFYEAVKAGVDAVMTSHPVYPKLDPVLQPATFSKKIVAGILRNRWNYTGVILTDDLEMGALKNICLIGESAVRAVEAGHDAVLVCKDPAAQMEVHAALVTAYETKRLSENELEQSARRFRRLKEKMPGRFSSGDPVAEAEGRSVARNAAKAGIKILKPGAGLPSQASADDPVCLIFPRLSALDKLIAVEEEMMNEIVYLEKLMETLGVINFQIQLIDISPDAGQIEAAVQAARNSRDVLLFSYDAKLNGANRELLKAVQAAVPRCTVVLLRDPYDVEFVREGNVCVSAYGFRTCQIEAAAMKIFSPKKVKV